MSHIDLHAIPEGATHYSNFGGGIQWYRSDGLGFVSMFMKRIPDVTPWNGESLPPVGTVCEVNYCESWQRCEVIAQFRQRCGMVAAFTVESPSGAKSLDAFGAEYFRPIRTPEQIVADKRADEVRRILDAMPHDVISGHTGAIVEWMLADGYRKPEIVDE